ncbi:MAG: ATP-binding cassette domain-containing protein, partial [Chloroflexota bacterium]|nr:ATP-binding cassette domain-containing protein [Chloroflexota bacterium]
MVKLLQGAPPQKLVEHHPLYLRGSVPEMQQIGKGPEDVLEQLQASNLTYRYPETGRGIAGIDIALTRGSITVITGRIASGKTTLLRVLLGLLPKDEGEIRWNGKVVSDPASFFVPPHSAYTAQVPQLFSGTLQENILLNLMEARADIERAISTA